MYHPFYIVQNVTAELFCSTFVTARNSLLLELLIWTWVNSEYLDTVNAENSQADEEKQERKPLVAHSAPLHIVHKFINLQQKLVTKDSGGAQWHWQQLIAEQISNYETFRPGQNQNHTICNAFPIAKEEQIQWKVVYIFNRQPSVGLFSLCPVPPPELNTLTGKYGERWVEPGNKPTILLREGWLRIRMWAATFWSSNSTAVAARRRRRVIQKATRY